MGSMVLLLLGLLLPIIHKSGAQSIGVCYGKIGSNLPPESEVIELYKSSGIGKMRIYWPDHPTLEALRGSGIDLVVDVPRENLEALAADPAAASGWLRDNVLPYSSDVNFRYIAVGNEVHPGDAEARHVLPAMQNLRAAVSGAGLGGDVRVSTAVDMSFVADSYPPSKGVFSNVDYAGPIARFLAETGSPLLANVYPYFAYAHDAAIDLRYALLDSSSEGVVMPDGTRYSSLLEAQVDSVYAALEKAGAEGVAVVVSETGWPSEGGNGASPENAAAYYRNLIERVKSGGGTPRRPQGHIEAYLFAMFDEDRKRGSDVERHFGLFSPDKQPKYQLSFT